MIHRRCIIIHGCPSDIEKAMDPEKRTYDKHWIPWTKNQLASRGIDVIAPLMPDPWYPDYEKYKTEFEKYTVNKNTILIGTSGGCAFLVRWLGETKKNIYKLILIAPWKIPSSDNNHSQSFYAYTIDESIKKRVQHIIMFTSDNEEPDGKKSLEIFHRHLGGEIIELHNHGHFVIDDMKTEQFPQLIEKALE